MSTSTILADWLRGGRGAWREFQLMEKGKKFGKRTFRFGNLVTP
jgi:hypothetical protein